MSQSQLGKALGVHGAVIGRYERAEVKPSVDAATQLAEALGVSLDYLAGVIDTPLDSVVMQKILDIQQLKDEEKSHVFALLDAFLGQTKMKQLITY